MSTYLRRTSGYLLAGLISTLLAGGVSDASASQDEVHVQKTRAAPTMITAGQKPGAESRSITVSYGDLDLAADAGNRALYRRLVSAARSVCGPTPGRDLAQHRDWSDCYTGALDAAVAETGSRPVAALHSERTGRQVAARIASRD